MKIEGSNLILENEVNDDMMVEFISLANGKDIKSITINTDNISSLVVQQLLCLKSSKEIICNDSFLLKFFQDVKLVS
jgi:hypothetical protein